MNIQQAREFLETNHRAILATTRRDGRAQLSPVTVAVDAEGRAIISTRDTAIKARNLRRDPYASLALINDGFYGDWAQIEGPAEIVEQPEALDLLDDYYRRASGEHPDWAEYREAMIRDRRVLLRITIERAGPTIEG
jgi:PPOX class probable F420-dependent enzyme